MRAGRFVTLLPGIVSLWAWWLAFLTPSFEAPESRLQVAVGKLDDGRTSRDRENSTA